MRISDWSSDVCSSDLAYVLERLEPGRIGLGEALDGDDWCHARSSDSVADRKASGSEVSRIAGRKIQAVTIGDGCRALQGGRATVGEIGRAQVGPPVTNAPLVCRTLCDKNKGASY